jgi:hypothetical protein
MPRFESPTQIDHVVRSIMVVDGFRPRSVRYEADDVMVDKERFHVYQNFECSMQRSCPCPPTMQVGSRLHMTQVPLKAFNAMHPAFVAQRIYNPQSLGSLVVGSWSTILIKRAMYVVLL